MDAVVAVPTTGVTESINQDATSTSVSSRGDSPLDSLAKPFPLLDLAPEIRSKIFECFFENYRVTIQCGEPSCDNPHGGDLTDDYDGYDEYECYNRLSVTRVSKLVRAESTTAFLRTATFDFQLLDHHVTWSPDDLLRSYIKRMKTVYGPPRLLHHLSLTTLSWLASNESNSRWVEDCAAEHVVCDMIIDQFDIADALLSGSAESQYFESVKNAIAGPKGDRLSLSAQVEDSDPTWNSWDESHIRSDIQIWNRKVVVRRKPKTEPGKTKLKNVLELLGLELEEDDKGILEPAKKNELSNTMTSATGGATALGVVSTGGHIITLSVSTTIGIGGLQNGDVTGIPSGTHANTSNVGDENGTSDITVNNANVVSNAVHNDYDMTAQAIGSATTNAATQTENSSTWPNLWADDHEED